MTFSYTQIASYLHCPKAYRYRYLDGWSERDDRASLLFGRCFEQALAALFRGNDCTAELFKQWSAYRDVPLEYSRNDSWDTMLRQGVRLLERFVQDDRVRIPRPQQSLRVKFTRELANGHDFVGYIDAIGMVDGERRLLEWKTTTARYPEEPSGLLALDPQLVCYSWLSGISEAAVVAFVRKHTPEIQYLKASITEEQRREFADLVANTVGDIEEVRFPSHSGIRFPRNGCLSCAHLGLCLDKPELVSANLIRRAGAGDLEWLSELDD
jgi:hypothetical protein